MSTIFYIIDVYIGNDAFGTTYKAMLKNGQVVVVKWLREVNRTQREFKGKIGVIAAMSHPNLMSLGAYYCSRNKKLLVYDFMPIGSLSKWLHGKPFISWLSQSPF
jgi:serine/threonine protein kinase